MDEKLEILLKQLGVENSFYPHFKDAKILKVDYFKKEDLYEFEIEIEDYLPIELYHFFFENIKICFPDAGCVSVRFMIRNKETSINEYFNYAISSILGDSPFMHLYKDCDIKYEDNVLIIEVANKAESMKLKSESKHICEVLSKMGFTDISMKLVINKEKSACILEEITAELKKEVKKDVKKVEKEVLMGSEIKSKSTLINNINFEEGDVTIDCMVFDIDYFESSKSAFRIVF